MSLCKGVSFSSPNSNAPPYENNVCVMWVSRPFDQFRYRVVTEVIWGLDMCFNVVQESMDNINNVIKRVKTMRRTTFGMKLPVAVSS